MKKVWLGLIWKLLGLLVFPGGPSVINSYPAQLPQTEHRHWNWEKRICHVFIGDSSLRQRWPDCCCPLLLSLVPGDKIHSHSGFLPLGISTTSEACQASVLLDHSRGASCHFSLLAHLLLWPTQKSETPFLALGGGKV